MTALAMCLAAIAWAPWSLGLGVRTARGSRRKVVMMADTTGFADLGLVLDLIAAALGSGCSIERGLRLTAQALKSEGLSQELVTVADRLAGGAPWLDAWAGLSHRVVKIERVLAPSWRSGAPAAALVRRAAMQARRRRRQAVVTASAQLSVSLVLPLGLCLLPAFVLLGLVPVVISLSSGLLSGS